MRERFRMRLRTSARASPHSKGAVRQADEVCPVQVIGLANLHPKPCQRKCSAFHSSPPEASQVAASMSGLQLAQLIVWTLSQISVNGHDPLLIAIETRPQNPGRVSWFVRVDSGQGMLHAMAVLTRGAKRPRDTGNCIGIGGGSLLPGILFGLC